MFSSLSVTSAHANTALQFAELKRVERDHAKEKQKLMKDKDAGPSIFFFSSPTNYLKFSKSKEPINQSEPDKDKDGEPRPGIAKGQWSYDRQYCVELSEYLDRIIRDCGWVGRVCMASNYLTGVPGRQQTTSTMCRGRPR